MSKVVIVLLGLALMAGAAGVAGYRYLVRTDQTSTVRPGVSQNATRGPARESSPGRQPDGARPPIRPGREQFSGYSVLELALDLINAIVGLVGIFVAILGMRMSRAATAVQTQVRSGS